MCSRAISYESLATADFSGGHAGAINLLST